MSGTDLLAVAVVEVDVVVDVEVTLVVVVVVVVVVEVSVWAALPGSVVYLRADCFQTRTDSPLEGQQLL